MRWLALAIVLASLRADARPVRDDLFVDDDVFDDRFVPSRLKRKRRPPKPSPPPCKSGTDFKKFMGCQFKGWGVDVMNDLPAAKLVRMSPPTPSSGNKQLALFLKVNNGWVRASVYADLNDQTELLSFAQVEAAYRVDLGFASPTWVTVDDITSRPAMLKRTFTYICDQNAYCRSVQSSCDVLVRGKTIATFRGTVKWNGKDIKVRGDDRNTNRYCVRPPPAMLETD